MILEAQASGLPVIVTDQGGPHENMIDGETGRVITGGEVSSLLETMQSLSRNPESVKKMGTRARSYTESRSFEAAFVQTWHMFDEVEQQWTASAP